MNKWQYTIWCGSLVAIYASLVALSDVLVAI